ncbi:MAG: hypothetical protein LBM62_07200 [Mediterranea sp.]|jgi:hypothetical protein|nr:hypothetical protein [Mediterranea sp.]
MYIIKDFIMKQKAVLVKGGVLLFASIILFSSCASIVSHASYPLSLNSDPQGAKVTIINKSGYEVFSGTTPSVIKLDASDGFFSKERYILTFTHPDYDSKVVQVSAKIDGWYFGNILLGGLIGMLIVDPATGAMWKLDTTNINVTLNPKPSANAELSILDIRQIPEEWKEYLVKLD